MGIASQFSPHEPRDIIVAWLVLSFAWGLPFLLQGLSIKSDEEFLTAILIATITGFILHELGHKFVAIRYGYVAHFRLWITGLSFAVITGVAAAAVGFPVLFGAPGAVYIMPRASGSYGAGYYSSNYQRTDPQKENLWISLAGPGLNLLFGVFFLFLYFFVNDPFLDLIALFGFGINFGLGAFNMIPVPPLDGYKIFRGSILAGLAVAIPLWAGTLYLLGFI